MKQQEHELQKAVVQMLTNFNIPFFAVPNGGMRNLKVAQKLKAEGVKAGVADIFIYRANSQYHGIFLELKVGANRQQKTQKEFQKLAEAEGFAYWLCYSVAEVYTKYQAYKNG